MSAVVAVRRRTISLSLYRSSCRAGCSASIVQTARCSARSLLHGLRTRVCRPSFCATTTSTALFRTCCTRRCWASTVGRRIVSVVRWPAAFESARIRRRDSRDLAASLSPNLTVVQVQPASPTAADAAESNRSTASSSKVAGKAGSTAVSKRVVALLCVLVLLHCIWGVASEYEHWGSGSCASSNFDGLKANVFRRCARSAAAWFCVLKFRLLACLCA